MLHLMSQTKRAKPMAKRWQWQLARKQNSIRWQNGEKNLDRTQAQSGGQFFSGQWTNSVWLWFRQHY